VNCPYCDSTAARAWAEKAGQRLLRCRRCGAIFLAEVPPGEAVQDLYQHYYDHASGELPAAARPSLEALVESAQAFRTDGRWLDLGFGEGALLEIARGAGWRCYGTEASPSALARGESRGFVVSAEPASDPRFPQGGFDVVSMVEFLEHVSEPRRFLTQAAGWLRPGGLLYLTTPNAHSANRWLLGAGWSVFAPPEHVVIAAPASLRRAAASAGFELVRLRTDGLNPGELLARVRAKGAAQPSRNEVGFRLNDAISRTPARRRLKRLINGGLTLLGVGDTLKVWATRH